MSPHEPVTLLRVPVFPLPDHFLFPGSVTPLHIFETRYRRLIHDLMDRQGRFVMAPCDPSEPRTPVGPALPELGTLAEIVQSAELDDGRWLILLLALDRVSLTEVPSDRLYRMVDARILPEPEADGGPAPRLRRELIAALQNRSDGDADGLPEEAALGRLADLLLQVLPLDTGRRRRAFTERDPVARASLALAWHGESDPSPDGNG